MLAWVRERTDPEEWERVREEIFSPFTGKDPDQVDARVIDEEMSLFESFSRQTKALGG